MAWESDKNSGDSLANQQREAIAKVKASGLPLVGICIPHTGNITMEFAEKSWGPIRWTQTKTFNKITFYSKVPSISVGRNNLADMAVKSECDYLFWLDSDILFDGIEPNEALAGLVKILEEDKTVDMVSGLYRAKKLDGFHFAAWHDIRENKSKGEPQYMPITEWTKGANWFEVDVAGFGCMLIRRKVFEQVERPWFVWNEIGDKSEDFYFIEKAKKKGFRVFVMADCKLQHIGQIKVMFDGSFKTLEV